MNAPFIQVLDESIFDVLEWIRKRPGMYIREPSIIRLDAFLGGYTGGLGRAKLMLRDTDQFHKFHDWVARQFGYCSSTSGWCNMIREKSASDAEAFWKFFKLLDEFKRDMI